MRTVRCSGLLSCHARPHPLPCTPPVIHAPCHTCPPLPCTSPAMHTPVMHAPCHAYPPATYAPCHTHPHPPSMHDPPATHAPRPLWTEFLTHACENITFPQLLLRTVKINNKSYATLTDLISLSIEVEEINSECKIILIFYLFNTVIIRNPDNSSLFEETSLKARSPLSESEKSQRTGEGDQRKISNIKETFRFASAFARCEWAFNGWYSPL